jgi:hypothetical protein
MWAAFQEVAPPPDQSYPNGVIESLRIVGDKIGGHVKINIDLGIQDIAESFKDDPFSFPKKPVGFTNACSIRMSYVFNKCGVHIPKSKLWSTVTGGDHRNYIYHVNEIKVFLLHMFGEPDLMKGHGAQPSGFAGRKGIMVFDVQFSDSSGHATLWNGTRAVDHEYFNPGGRLTLSGVKLWECP